LRDGHNPHQPLAISHQPSAISHQPSAISQTTTADCQLLRDSGRRLPRHHVSDRDDQQAEHNTGTRE
jgi:hypothetical protein